MFVGARPWQLLHTYPAPEPEWWGESPFEIVARPDEDRPSSLAIRIAPDAPDDVTWFDLTPEAQRVASAIALDLVAHDLPEIYRQVGYIPYENDIETINDYIQQLERDPTGKTISEDVTDEIHEITNAYETSGVGQPLAMFGEALKASVIDIQLNVRPARLRIVLYCIVILSEWLDYPWAGYGDDYYRPPGSGVPSFSITYQSVFSPITLTELTENGEEWAAIWWAEVMNALAMRDATSAQIQ